MIIEIEKYSYLVPNVFLFNDRRCFPDWVIKRRKNYFHDLTFVIAGKACYYVNDVEYLVQAGDLVYIPPGSIREAHTFKENPMHAYPFNFHWMKPNNHVRLPFGIATRNMITKEVLDYIREFKRIWMNQQPFYVIQARAIFELIISRLLTTFFRCSTSPIDPRVKKAMDYIGDYYSKDITNHDLAEMVGLHPVYLSKLFKQHTGSTTREYINRIRVNNAEMMLSAGDFTVTETAERCGFYDVSYFSKVFKAIKGYPPSLVKKTN